jgi:putative transposase
MQSVCTLHLGRDGVGQIRLGIAAQDCWNATPAHFPFVDLGEFVVMPNHVHGIIIINKPIVGVVETQDLASLQQTQNFTSIQHNHPTNKFGPQSRNLASIVRGYKIGVTKYAHQNAIPFSWQARYHDHVIRDAGEFERISWYILANPQNWEKEEFHSVRP